jgi:hypothetical protein
VVRDPAPPAEPRPSTDRLVDGLLVVALAWVAASFLIHELCSLDVWWQLAIGEDILEHFRIPDSNLYSAAAHGRPYHDSHWLFQLLLALTHRAVGLSGPVLFMAVAWGFTLGLLYREVHAFAGTATATLITFLVLGASAERFLPRPELVTFVMVVLFYSRLRRGRFETAGQIGLLVLLQVIWLNSHGLFVIGPFMVGCYWLVEAVACLRKRDHQLKRLTVALASVCAALLVSPQGLAPLQYSFLLFGEVGSTAPEHMRRVNELSPVFGTKAMSGSAFWFFAALLALAVASLAINFRRIPAGRLLIVAGLALAAFTGRRNIVLFALVAAPFAAENLSAFPTRLRVTSRLRCVAKLALAAVLVAWSLYPLSGRYYLDMEIPARFGLGVTPDFFPHGLKGFVEESGIRGQVYNTNRLGGFYMYHFYPDRLPFSDGRWEVYGNAFFEERRRALRHYPAWKDWVAGYGVEVALLHHTAGESAMLVPALYNDPEWSLVYYDFAASLFVKTNAVERSTPIVFSESSKALEGRVRPDSRLMLSAFYRNLGLDGLLIDNLERVLASGGENRNVLLELAGIHMRRQEFEEAERRYLQLLEIEPRRTDALRDLAFIHYTGGRYEQALAFSTRAVEANPGNVDLRFNRVLILLAMGREAEAREQLNAILETDPGYTKARQLLERL